MADATTKPLHPSLPANYVSFLDLRDRWMKRQQQRDREPKPREELQPIVENARDELQLLTVDSLQADVKPVVGEDKGSVADHRLESDSPPQPAGESVVRSNRSPKNAPRMPFQAERGNRRQAERGNHHRWVQVSPTKSPPALPLTKPNRAPKIQASQPEPAPVVPKALPVLLADLSKPPPSETPKADHAVQVPTEIHSSDKEVTNRRFGRGKRNQKANRNEDLVQSQPEKDALAPNRDLEERPNPKVQASQYEPAALVPVDPKALPVLHADLSKPPPLETPKADHAVQVVTKIHNSDNEVTDRRFGRGKMKQPRKGKRNQKTNRNEDLVQSQPEKGVLAPNRDLEERLNPKIQLETKAQPLMDPKVVRSVQPRDEIQGSGEVVNDANLDRAKTEKKKKSKNKKKRGNQKEDNLSPNVDLDETVNSKQGIEPVRENKDAAENSKAEIEGKFAGLSVSGTPEESGTHKSVAARNHRGWKNGGRFAKFESRVMSKHERAKMESDLVWVKKGEASQIGAAPVLKGSNMWM